MASRGGARTGAGRKKSEVKTTTLTLRMTENDMAIIKQHAEMSGSSVNRLAILSIKFGEERAYNALLRRKTTTKNANNNDTD